MHDSQSADQKSRMAPRQKFPVYPPWFEFDQAKQHGKSLKPPPVGVVPSVGQRKSLVSDLSRLRPFGLPRAGPKVGQPHADSVPLSRLAPKVVQSHVEDPSQLSQAAKSSKSPGQPRAQANEHSDVHLKRIASRGPKVPTVAELNAEYRRKRRLADAESSKSPGRSRAPANEHSDVQKKRMASRGPKVPTAAELNEEYRRKRLLADAERMNKEAKYQEALNHAVIKELPTPKRLGKRSRKARVQEKQVKKGIEKAHAVQVEDQSLGPQNLLAKDGASNPAKLPPLRSPEVQPEDSMQSASAPRSPAPASCSSSPALHTSSSSKTPLKLTTATSPKSLNISCNDFMQQNFPVGRPDLRRSRDGHAQLREKSTASFGKTHQPKIGGHMMDNLHGRQHMGSTMPNNLKACQRPDITFYCTNSIDKITLKNRVKMRMKVRMRNRKGVKIGLAPRSIHVHGTEGVEAAAQDALHFKDSNPQPWPADPGCTSVCRDGADEDSLIQISGGSLNVLLNKEEEAAAVEWQDTLDLEESLIQMRGGKFVAAAKEPAPRLVPVPGFLLANEALPPIG